MIALQISQASDRCQYTTIAKDMLSTDNTGYKPSYDENVNKDGADNATREKMLTKRTKFSTQIKRTTQVMRVMVKMRTGRAMQTLYQTQMFSATQKKHDMQLKKNT